jgi:uncharacterized membrane protein YhiD involved in acid resistance
MGLTNRVENIIITAATAIVTTVVLLLIVHSVSIRPLQRQIERQNAVIVELARIEKYRYEIRNDFEKIKSRDSQVVIDLDNKLSSLQVNKGDTLHVDSTDQRKRFWKKLKFWE